MSIGHDPYERTEVRDGMRITVDGSQGIVRLGE